MPKVSVIMGVYNCKNIALLYKSVQSIIKQTFSDWELIICDDGSTDNTINELKKLEELDSRIRIIGYSKNKGLSYALNMCAKAANGEYLARQDDDDISLSDRFEKQIHILDNHKEYAIVGCNAVVVDDNGIWGGYVLEERPTKLSFLWSNPFAHPTVMMRAEVLNKLDYYRVEKETRRCEDYDLFMRMYADGYIGYNIQEKLYEYRIINGNKKYRPMNFRIEEAIVRYTGFKRMGILFKGFPYIFKPIIIGLIPQRIFKYIRKNQY